MANELYKNKLLISVSSALLYSVSVACIDTLQKKTLSWKKGVLVIILMGRHQLNVLVQHHLILSQGMLIAEHLHFAGQNAAPLIGADPCAGMCIS